MQVKAKETGFYGGHRKRPGQVFSLTTPKHFSDKWMEKVSESAQVITPAIKEPTTFKELNDLNEAADKETSESRLGQVVKKAWEKKMQDKGRKSKGA